MIDNYTEQDYELRDPEYSSLVDELEDMQEALNTEFDY